MERNQGRRMSAEEKLGILGKGRLARQGAKMIFANAMATVPQIVIIIRKLYGGGGLAMHSLRPGGDLSIAWPTVARGLMGAEGAVSILYSKALSTIY